MNKLLRRLRGILGIGSVWGSAGLSVGALLGAISSIIFEGGFSLAWALSSGAFFGLFGFLSGVGFAGTLATLDGKKSLEDLSPARSALWGLIAGAAFAIFFVVIRDGTLFPLFWQKILPPMVALGALGASLGAGTVLVARKATGQLPSSTGEPLEETTAPSDPPRLASSEDAHG